MRRPVFAANWKMNHGPTEARAFIAAFTAKWSPRTDRTVILFPPALSLSAVTSALANRTDIGVGVQNIWFEDKGPFTGENSAPMARDAGARYTLVGHSERRHIFGETDEQTARKCVAAVRDGLMPILCVGELLSEREQGVTNDVVLRQLHAGLGGLGAELVDKIAIAYEPVWAIGTGKTATPGDASAVHAVIHHALRHKFANASELPPILYGGSVNSANCSRLSSADWVDGLLVGGASLDVETWTSICRT